MQNKAFSSVFCLRYFKEGKVKKRKTIKHRQFTIDEKNEIVKGYLSRETGGYKALMKKLYI